MKIKKSLILLSVSSAAICCAAALLFSHQGKVTKLSAGENTNDYTIIFTKDNVHYGSYDTTNSVHKFSIGNSTAIEYTPTQKYELFSKDFDAWSGTYFYDATFGDASITWGVNYIFELVNNNSSNGFAFEFEILNRAELNLNDSHVGFFVNDADKMTNTKFVASGDGTQAGYKSYVAYTSLGSYYGDSIKVAEVKLVFSCAK